jgi:ethanolamine utilization protein EutA (predicted chaperonin)
MVDLMMWLVIAAMLLAAALQGITYYKKVTITHLLKNDAVAVRAYMEKEYAANGHYPEGLEVRSAAIRGEIKLSNDNSITGVSSMAGQDNWAVRICSPHLDPMIVGAAVRIERDSPNTFDFRVCLHSDDV